MVHGRLFVENLEAVSGDLHNKDSVFIIDFYRYWSLKSLLSLMQTLGHLASFRRQRIQLYAFLSPLRQSCFAG